MKRFSLLPASLSALVFCCIGVGGARTADVPLDKVNRIPPKGVTVPAADRAELEAGLKELAGEITAIRQQGSKPARAKLPGTALDSSDLLPDVEIYYNAVHYALAYDEFFRAGDIAKGKALLKEGLGRARALRAGKPGWLAQSGPVARGYVSKIDGSVQPYGLVIPATVAQNPDTPHRLDIWYHGRGEALSEINFISEREKSLGDFAPANTIVLHPYGRYCNANRFAGEVDTFEAMDNVKKRYAIDPNRILVRGFSMGGASCWMFATHYSGLWAAAAPGAGFSETSGFLNIRDLSTIPWYQQKLWHLYDSTDYAINLSNCPTVAYSGAADHQKQAADEMAAALAKVGIELVHVIGPGKTGHWYEATAKVEVARRVDELAAIGRNPTPRHIRFTTWSLKYNQVRWLRIDAMEHERERAEISADVRSPYQLDVATRNVTAFTVSFPPGASPFALPGVGNVPKDAANAGKPFVAIDANQAGADSPALSVQMADLRGGPLRSDRSWVAHFHKANGHWAQGSLPADGLRKRHGLQGPIDDAFMDSFIMVKPTGKPINDAASKWVAGEQQHAIEHWRRQFRGEARAKDDVAITDTDIANSNLVLWGDPSSNKILAKIAGKLPIRWDDTEIHVAGKTYPSASHVPVMIYPNPLNPNRYVVVNSGFTFREYDYENNARQTPKLPDWAIVDITIPPSAQRPGGIPAAGFFGELWELVDVK